MKYDVSIVGPLNIDLIMVGDGPQNWDAIQDWGGAAEMEMVAAGSVGYTVRDFSRLGLKAKVYSCVPQDSLGAFIIENLQHDHVDCGGVKIVPGTQAGIGVYILLFGSRKRPLCYRLPTHHPWQAQFSPSEIDDLLDTRLLHNGGYLHFRSMYHSSLVDLFREARQRGVMTSIDPQFPLHVMNEPWVSAMYDILPYVDILMCDENEARHISGLDSLIDAASALLHRGITLVVIKQGDRGADIFKAGWSYHQDAIKYGELVDSIGAGDAFDAAFLYSRLQNWSLEDSARFAAAAAGMTVTGMGGCSAMPTSDTLKVLLNMK